MSSNPLPLLKYFEQKKVGHSCKALWYTIAQLSQSGIKNLDLFESESVNLRHLKKLQLTNKNEKSDDKYYIETTLQCLIAYCK